MHIMYLIKLKSSLSAFILTLNNINIMSIYIRIYIIILNTLLHNIHQHNTYNFATTLILNCT